MFITVRYGENKSEIFNPKCRVLLLLNAIRDKCGCNRGDTIDLADETGEVMELASHPGDYASNYLPERATFVLIKVEREPDSCGEEDVRYLPLFKGSGLSKTFLARLNKRSRLPDLPDVNERRPGHSSRLLSRAPSRRLSVPVMRTSPKTPSRSAAVRTGVASAAGVKRDLVTGLKRS